MLRFSLRSFSGNSVPLAGRQAAYKAAAEQDHSQRNRDVENLRIIILISATAKGIVVVIVAVKGVITTARSDVIRAVVVRIFAASSLIFAQNFIHFW